MGGEGGMGGSAGVGGMTGDVVYEQNFNLLDINGATIGDGWFFFVNVFAEDGTYKFGYNNPPQAAPNGPQICALVDDQGGPEQEPQQLSVYSDYECCQPDSGHINGTDLVETNVFQEGTVAAEDVGTTLTFSFDAKRGNIEGGTTANAFIKTLDPDDGFAVSASDTQDTTALGVEWNRYSVELPLDASLEGHILQFGFQTNASNYESSGNYYDNVVVTQSPTAP